MILKGKTPFVVIVELSMSFVNIEFGYCRLTSPLLLPCIVQLCVEMHLKSYIASQNFTFVLVVVLLIVEVAVVVVAVVFDDDGIFADDP